MRRQFDSLFCALALTVACGLSARAAFGQGSAGAEPLTIHGFGGWAAGYTDNDNLYPDYPAPVASKDLEVENYYFTLNLLARPGGKFLVHAQPTWESSVQGTELSLDLAYVQMTLFDNLVFRAGKIRNPLSLYTEIYKVGTLRPFYLRPSAYYRLAPESYLGVGVNHVQPIGSWELEIDALAGQMNFDAVPADVAVGFDPTTLTVLYATLPFTAQGRDMFGGGLLVRSPIAGLEFGVSAYSMKLWGGVPGAAMRLLVEDPEQEEREKAYAVSAEYLNDKLSLRAEILLARGYEDLDCGYVEAAYHITPEWQVAATYQHVDLSKPTPIVPALSKDQTWGLALNYWVSPQLVWKLDYYRVTDNRTARTADAVNDALQGTLEKDTNVVIAGMHFSF